MRLFSVLTILCLSLVVLGAQETRSTINGRVYDQQSAAVGGAKVVVTHTDTNAAVTLTTNETGYYEAPLLIPGNYKVSAEAAGFKTVVRDGIVLQVGQQLAIDLKLDVGAVTETVQVTAEAPVLDTSSVEAGALIDNKDLMELPVLGNNPTLLTKLMPGMFNTDGVNNYLGLHSIAGGSGYTNSGGVGGNEWSIDGVPNNGGSRQAAYLPYSDSISEFRIDTTGFDVSQGRGTGASIMAMTKAGTNQYHGTATWQHWQQRFNATPYFTRQLYFKNIADAEAAGNTALANQLRNTERQSSGHSNNWAATIGGPVVIPKLYNGKNKLFVFFSYNGFKDNKTEEANQFNKTVPTMKNRNGDFTDLLAVDAVKYTIYDPLTVGRDTSRPTGTYYIRDAMPGNIVPKSRILMPKMYKFISDLYPIPNNDPTDPKMEPRNNYMAVATPWLWDYRAYQNRIDYNLNQSHRFFGRWSWNNFDEDRQDWTYSTIRGMNTGGINRKNMGATADWTWTINGSTLLDISGAANEFTSGNNKPVPMRYKPTDLGLPQYLDDIAGDQHIIPRITLNGYTQPVPDGVPTFTRQRIFSIVSNLSHFRGKHSFKAGADTRFHFRTGGGGGATSGYFQFDERYTRKYGDTNLQTPGQIGLSWAAFMMGLNYNSQIASGITTYATYSPYTGGYFQDSIRLTRKLTVNLGFRLEWEGGPTERYNRVIGYFDPNAVLSLTETSTAALKAKPPAPFTLGGNTITIDPNSVRIMGGVTFPGVNGVPRQAWQGQAMFMPRMAFAYNISPKTVIRGGVGTFYDTLNVTHYSPNQTGFNKTTQFATEKNAGSTWQTGDPANGISPLMDPFPANRPGGARFDMSSSGALGADTQNGSSYTYSDYPTKRSHQYRWRIGVQRQIGRDNVVTVTYNGSYSRDVYVSQNLNALPAQYFWNGIVRNSAWSSALDGGVSSPFNLTTYYSGLATSNPLLYADMAGKTFFTDSNIARSKLLRPYPTVNTGLTNDRSPLGQVRTNGLEVVFNRRFSRGFNLMGTYMRTSGWEAAWFPNEFDLNPAWRPSNYSRPHRVTATGMYQFPFGRRRAFFKDGIMSKLLGGMQLSGTFEYQPGQLVGDWGNRYYYGDIKDIVKENPTLDEWFNTKGTDCTQTAGEGSGWERCSQKAPAGYQTRIFPIRVDGLRRDKTLQTNANVQKEIPLKTERTKLILRFDMLNVFNRYQFDNPNIDPMNTDFGRVTQQTAAQNRFLQFQLRLQY
jgi:hypothetical protein